jgi:uncharacterized protein
MNLLKRLVKSDSWQNVVTQLGTSYDKQVYHRIYPEIWYDCDELEDLRDSDAYARRIVEEPIHAAFRNGFELIYGGQLDAETIEDMKKGILDILWSVGDPQEGAIGSLQEALCNGRLYGRGGLLLGLDDGQDPEEPLSPERIRGLRWIEPLTCQEFNAFETYDDPTEPHYGEPKIWKIQRTSTSTMESELVHESRVILTRGLRVSKRKRSENLWRDASVLQALYPKLRAWDAANQGVGHMLMDASQAVLKIQDFVRMLGENEISVFTNRMRIMEVARSLRILPIDAEREAFEYVERTFAGVADLLDRGGKDLAGAAGLPQTVLFGVSPAGLNATGESDIRGWYDQIQAERTKKIQPLLESLVYYAAIVAAADAPETWGVKWNPLWQESAGEQAGRYKTVAETDQIYVNLGVVTEDEVAETRFSSDEFNDGPIQLDMETRSSLREMDLERVAEGVPEPEPPQAGEPEPEDADDPA